MKKCKIIGLTGQSGAGKSTASDYLAKNGFSVINADTLVKKIYESDSPCIKAVCAAFGADILGENGTLDRKLLAQRAFFSKENTALLNSIVHPFVTAYLLSEIKKEIKNGATMIVYDAPQLFESNADVICDEIVSITAKSSVRLERICSRDNIPRELAVMRMNAQLDEKFFAESSDYIVENNSGFEEFTTQLESLVKKLCE